VAKNIQRSRKAAVRQGVARRAAPVKSASGKAAPVKGASSKAAPVKSASSKAAPRKSSKKSPARPRAKRGAAVSAQPGKLGNVEAIAERIRSIRKRKHVSLQTLAAKAGLDKGYLSRIERGEKAPSVATLLNIAAALDLQVAQLFGAKTPDEAVTLVRAKDHLAMAGKSEGGGAFYEAILPASASRRMSVFLIDPSHLAPMEKTAHPGDELIYVISGAIEVEFSDRVMTLGPGDALHFPGDIRHEIRRTSGQAAQALVIVANDLSEAGKLGGKKD
jgi:transcriptional regulator with XRE-family HTH domain